MLQNNDRRSPEPAADESGEGITGADLLGTQREVLARLVGRLLATEWLSRRKTGDIGPKPPPEGRNPPNGRLGLARGATADGSDRAKNSDLTGGGQSL